MFNSSKNSNELIASQIHVYSCCRSSHKSLVPHAESEIPDLLPPSALFILLKYVIVGVNITMSGGAPRSCTDRVASEEESISLARFFTCHAKIAYDPARNSLHHSYKCPPQIPVLCRRRCAAGYTSIHKTWSAMDERNVLLAIICSQVVERQACQEGGMCHDCSNPPFLLEAYVILIDFFLVGAIQDGEDAWL
jgi:hypothetical protein